jgi:glucose/arabinose dehydrogenase
MSTRTIPAPRVAVALALLGVAMLGVGCSSPEPLKPAGSPVATIVTPPAGTTYHAGQTIQFSGSGTDAEGAALPGTALSWWAELHHDTHTHPFMPAAPGPSGSVVIPTMGEVSANVWYRFYLRAADPAGAADTAFRDILPETAEITVTSTPVGRTITLDGQPHVTPYTVTGVVGIERELGAPSPQTGTDSIYAFQSWSDGGAQTHTLSTPASNTTVTAQFHATGPANQPPTVAITAPAPGSSSVVNTPVAITATAGDADGSVSYVEFFDGAVSLGRDSSAPYGASWTPTTTGAHSLTARAADNDGATTTSAAVGVTVTGGGSDTEAPVVMMTAPADGVMGLTGVVTATATATDNVGVAGVEFQLDGESLGEDTGAPYQMALPATSGYTTGVHQVRVRARDTAGNLSAWAVARVTFGGNVDQPTGFMRTTFVQNLGTTGTAMTFAPDGRLFICEQGGDLRVVKGGSLLAKPFVHVPTTANGERGLLGVTFHPSFGAANQYVYVYYTLTTAGTSHNRISRFTANGDTAMTGSELVITDLPNLSTATNHNGGAIHFGPDGRLYVAVGDNANGSNSQVLTTRLGKVLRYNDDGTIPAGNPFLATATGPNQAIWAMGLRNPFTFGFQPGTGRLFINDVGEVTWEEINEGVAGANYGWPTTEGATTDPAFTGPLFTYKHSANPTLVVGFAIVGSAFYNPTTALFPSNYVGNYFFADYVNQWVNRLDLSTGNAAAYAFARLPGSVTDLAVGPDGALYALGVQLNGTWGVWRFTH